MRQETRSVKIVQPGTLLLHFCCCCENCTGNQLISLGRKMQKKKTSGTKAAWAKPRYAFLIANLALPDKNKRE